MKFAATINLAGIDDAGLSSKTDLADWVIIEYIADWYTAPKATKRADKVWINYKHLMAQVPILGIKSKSAVSARLHRLAALGLLIVEQDDDGRLFASLGQAAIDVRCFRVDRSPDREVVHENERGVHENERGGVRENEHTVDNQFLSDNQIIAGSQARQHVAGKNGIAKIAKSESKSAAIWAAYSTAYFNRYGTDPVRNAKVNRQLCDVVDRLGAEEAPQVAAGYVGSGNSFYVLRRHSVDLLLRDCESLRTEWATGTRMSATEARHLDEHQTSAENAKWLRENMDNLRAARKRGEI